MHTSTAAGSLPASPPPPEAETLSFHIDVLLRFATVMVALLALAALPQSSFFPVTGVDVRGMRRVSEYDIIARSGVRSGVSRFTIRAADVAARVTHHPKIASAMVAVQPSGRVQIAVMERRAIAAASYNNSFLLVDASRVVVEVRSDPDGLPVLKIDGMSLPWVKLGEEIPARQIRQALRVLELLPPSAKRTPLEIKMDSSGEFAIVSGSLLVLLGPIRGLGERAAMLPQVLSAMRHQKIAAQYVDLRFLDNIVVRPVTEASAGGDGR